MSLTFTQKLKLETNNAIVLVSGLKQNGRELIAEMEMTKEQIEQLERDSKSGKEIILKKYGTIISINWKTENIL